ncbi:unnamed protein product [Cladocopium goreaui]|uniref:Uncharacterized protein n=1 Tax=Cladocopium goreaui TaxID=2562237 RepID=A0A9P1GDS9_9DINO|nr:unnamed protein product [Cladocopium goreaui]
MTFYVACPPGFYELEVVPGSPTQCQECPAGFYCAGGWPADLSPCPAGSVSMRQSVASTDCLCRGGFYWDDSVGACLACPVGKYKDWIGRASGCGKICPSLTTSSGGAANVWECFCSGNSIDTDSALESFECTDLETLSSNSSERDVFLAVAATVYSFNGSLQVQDASTEALFLEIEDWLHQLLDMASVRARLELSVTFEASNWYVDFIGWSSDRGVAYILQDKFDPIPFQVWIAGMTGTALDSAQLVSCSEVASVLLQCPAGLGLQEGHPIIDLNDCTCPHGKQPAVSGASGLEAGCVPCPLGQYKSSVGDTSCVACPTTPKPLTTLQEGSMSYSACTYICPAGSFNDDPMNPSSCQPCGLGFYCPYKENRGACNESQTTVDEAASSITECLCAPGFLDAGSGACQACATGKYKSLIGNAQCSVCAAGTSASEGQATCDECEAGRFATAGAGTCDPCPAGRYSLNPAATSVDSCVLCPIGTWGNTAAASLMSACVPCVSGSTTALPAADSEALCARPNASHSKTCISGRTCAIDGIAGSSLQDGHRMAITSSACSDAKLAVSGIISSGISKAATQNGGSYEWGDVYTDFTPLGGVYNLCWCASMGILTCDNLNSNFVITPGQLLVTGPFANQLECLRGSDCTDLAFSGYDLLASDQIAVRLDACGRSVAEQISISNVNGLGDLQASGTDWVLGFGVSTNDHDYHLYIDASNAGYFLCWCASERGSNTACATADFAVYAGRLRVTGPNTNQESACAVGQECSVTGIRGVSMQSGDRLMILSDCGRGNAIPGLPSSGILETADGNNFAFVGNVSSVILSVAGIFRICFCRPAGDTCGTAVGFQARVGLMTASGPFDSTTECQLGSNCTVDMSGIGLDVGDQLFFTSGTCGSSNALSELGFTQLQDPVPLEQSASGLQVLLGELPISANPGLYSICWCPKSAACTSPALFRAPAGLLQVDCPPGTFAVGPSTGQTCESCTRGFYCAGGRPEIAARVSCVDGRTTLSKGSVTIDACVCDRGFRLDVASSACVACELNSYKSQPGNLEACTPCPSGFTTYTTGSVWASSCHNIASDVPGDTSSPGVGVSNDSGNGSADNDTDSGNSTPVQLQPVQPATQNESSVPAITFSMSLSNFPVQAGAGDLKEQLKAVFARTLSATTRLDQNAIQIEIIGLDTSNSSRRLRRLAAPTGPTVVITIKARSPEEAAETASDMDVNVVTSEVMTAVQQHPTLADIGIQLTPESDIAITTATVTCPQHQAVPPGVPVLSPEDCQCSPGYSPAADTCEPCRRGKYKVDVSNGACTDCPQLMSTLNEGATSMLECQCEAGLYADENGACIACLEGFYCPGTGQAVICPQNSTTVSPGSSQQSACICLAGYYFASAELWCEPCQRRRYKPNQGNGECALTCPTNADSELASTSLDDCFCMPGFHANIDSAGKLASCTSCSYQGLICEGGFVKANLTNLTNLSNIPQVHAQPLATPGFYQTGQSSSVECDVLLPDGSSACRGGGLCVAQRLQLPTPSGCNGVFGNACAEGSTGMLCGECPEGFSRDNYPELCQPCPAGAAALLSVGILSDIFQKAFLNFVVAAMAATSAVKGSAKLHTSMIRIGTQWLAACSVINQFNLDRLSGFEWAQKQAEMDQLTACSEANATECVVDQQAGNFAWPKEISDAINWVFNLMTVAPRLGSVEFSAQCHAEELLPGDKLAKMVAPGIYYISSPLLAMIGVLLVCSVMVYVVVPVFATAGIYFNNAAKAKQKKKKIIKALKKALEPLLPDAGLSWTDVQESEILESHHDATLESAALEPQKFIEGSPLQILICLNATGFEDVFLGIS